MRKVVVIVVLGAAAAAVTFYEWLRSKIDFNERG